jgi:predicted anti-sigma-YlaC factor YlaD
MNCQYTEKISLLVDGEMSAEETRNIEAHLASCADCEKLKNDFLFFRRQIKESARQMATTTADILPNQKLKNKNYLWRRQVSLPVSAFALIVIALAAFGVWSAFLRFGRSGNNQVAEITKDVAPPDKKSALPEQSELSLARFDKGGRAEIYTIRRQLGGGNEPGGNRK